MKYIAILSVFALGVTISCVYYVKEKEDSNFCVLKSVINLTHVNADCGMGYQIYRQKQKTINPPICLSSENLIVKCTDSLINLLVISISMCSTVCMICFVLILRDVFLFCFREFQIEHPVRPIALEMLHRDPEPEVIEVHVDENVSVIAIDDQQRFKYVVLNPKQMEIKT